MYPDPQSPHPLDRVDHVAIQVSGALRAIDRYRRVFDIDVPFKDQRRALLRCANINLALVIPERHPPHIAVVNDAAERSGTLNTHRDGTRSIYIHDSEDNANESMASD